MSENRIDAEKDDAGWPVWRNEMLAEASAGVAPADEPSIDFLNRCAASEARTQRCRHCCVPFILAPDASVMKAFMPGGCVPFTMRGPRP